MIVLWCNGSTADFGSVSLGSNPSRTTKINKNNNNMKITKEYLESIGFTISEKPYEWCEVTEAYKAVGELEIYVYLLKNNTNLKIVHRQCASMPIIRLLNCESIDKFNLALLLVDINPTNCEMS